MFEHEIGILARYCDKLDYSADLAEVKDCLELVVLYLQAGFYDLACLYTGFLSALCDGSVCGSEVAEAAKSVIAGVSSYKY